MRKSMTSLSLVIAMVVSIGLAGCGTTEMATGDMETAEADTEPDISWLTKELTGEGVFVQSRGSAGFELRAQETSRLIINSQDIIDAYHYATAREASEEAIEFATAYPSLDVYQRQGLVVIRYTDRAHGLAETFADIMGGTV